ncbi:SAM-dependent methyltransferase [Candidatus Uabimicrobium sp. HlEnr_7]|uniref:SAM-dependent methyltransferase n=1 Tax=Candidatus Uabimicrobium helgolandensis TaxID=3095367 RepID=UPI0035575306
MIQVKPIGWIENSVKQIRDDHWGSIESTICLDDKQFTSASLATLDSFSHVVVLFYMHKVSEEKIQYLARHPRNQKHWPKVGIFAQRAKSRPNKIGVSVCKIVCVKDLKVIVVGLDAIDKTPVLDIKPYMEEFAPKSSIEQPSWSRELMKNYYL